MEMLESRLPAYLEPKVDPLVYSIAKERKLQKINQMQNSSIVNVQKYIMGLTGIASVVTAGFEAYHQDYKVMGICLGFSVINAGVFLYEHVRRKRMIANLQDQIRRSDECNKQYGLGFDGIIIN